MAPRPDSDGELPVSQGSVGVNLGKDHSGGALSNLVLALTFQLSIGIPTVFLTKSLNHVKINIYAFLCCPLALPLHVAATIQPLGAPTAAERVRAH